MICARSLCVGCYHGHYRRKSQTIWDLDSTQTVISVPCSTVGAPWYYIQLKDCKAEGKKEFSEKDIMEWCSSLFIKKY